MLSFHDPFRIGTLLLTLFCVAVLIWLIHWIHSFYNPPRFERIWQCVRYGGGGSVETPRRMTEEKALDFCRSLGSVMHVDREHGFIFYRPKT